MGYCSVAHQPACTVNPELTAFNFSKIPSMMRSFPENNSSAELTQHIPEKGEHLVRYYGWYSHRQRGIQAKLRQAEEPVSQHVPIDRSALHAEKSASGRPRAGSLSTWAMLIKRVYEVDPLACPSCGGRMKIISFIERGQRALEVLPLDLLKGGENVRWILPVSTCDYQKSRQENKVESS